MKPEVMLLFAATPSEKIQRVLTVVYRHFESREALMIFVSDQKSADYLDNLLWRMPPESFLPHQVCNEESQELIVITETKSNLNHAKISLNLTKKVCPQLRAFEQIYELVDTEKSWQWKEKREHYQAFGFTVAQTFCSKI